MGVIPSRKWPFWRECPCSVKRIAEEVPVVHVDHAAERENRLKLSPMHNSDFPGGRRLPIPCKNAHRQRQSFFPVSDCTQ